MQGIYTMQKANTLINGLLTDVFLNQKKDKTRMSFTTITFYSCNRNLCVFLSFQWKPLWPGGESLWWDMVVQWWRVPQLRAGRVDPTVWSSSTLLTFFTMTLGFVLAWCSLGDSSEEDLTRPISEDLYFLPVRSDLETDRTDITEVQSKGWSVAGFDIIGRACPPGTDDLAAGPQSLTKLSSTKQVLNTKSHVGLYRKKMNIG